MLLSCCLIHESIIILRHFLCLLYRISSNKHPPRRLLNFETEVRRLLEGGACYKVREMNNIKCQDFVIFSLNINNTFSALLLAY